MSFADVINEFSTGTYTISRRTGGTWVDGRYTRASPTTLTATMSEQPLSGSDLETLDEGQSTNNVRKYYTTTELFSRKDNQDPDELSIDSETWIVINVETWKAPDETFYKVLAMKVDRQ